MEVPPAVQYVTTPDGWSIAFTVRGSGSPLVCLTFSLSHAQHVWHDSSATQLMMALAKRFRVVYYDGRGQGLSQRGLPSNTTLDSFLLDLEAVITASAVDRPVLFATGASTFAAVRYAHENPDRVSGLALMHFASSLPGGAVSLAESNWDQFLSMMAGGITLPHDIAERRRMLSRVERLKRRTTQEDFVRRMGVLLATDLTDILPHLQVPVLVLHPLHQQVVGEEAATRAAALIPRARLVVLDTEDYFGGGEEAAAAIASFLAEVQAATTSEDRNGSSVAHQLSRREIEVLKLIAAGKSNREIAADLVISLNTVTRHISHIFAKTGAANRAEAAAYATRRGLV